MFPAPLVPTAPVAPFGVAVKVTAMVDVPDGVDGVALPPQPFSVNIITLTPNTNAHGTTMRDPGSLLRARQLPNSSSPPNGNIHATVDGGDVSVVTVRVTACEEGETPPLLLVRNVNSPGAKLHCV